MLSLPSRKKNKKKHAAVCLLLIGLGIIIWKNEQEDFEFSGTIKGAIMNISTGTHLEVLIKISSVIDIVMCYSNTKASNHLSPKWMAIYMQLIIKDFAVESPWNYKDLEQWLGYLTSEGFSTGTGT